ncbi:hypothetical protein [Oleiharenicola lentus]|uniref:hypothetical protein n=1 Tax=Oleiharenicola lentus TaxID=2508720 RepID=UPI003F671D4A
MKTFAALVFLICALNGFAAPSANSAFVATDCEGVYPQHLQGVCTDERETIYWSWTDQLVKTDRHGKILRKVAVEFHHGDLCYHEGRVYVAVNLGKFNEPPGQENSWVYVYDGDTLAEIAKHPVPELVHGAGGIAYHNGTFIVVGGLPKGVNENYLYEYDEHFRFRQRHVLASGYTFKGIQTAAFYEGAWWFGTYGDTRYLMRADRNFKLTDKWIFDASLGLVPLGRGRFLIGHDSVINKSDHTGRIAAFRFDQKTGLSPEAGTIP